MTLPALKESDQSALLRRERVASYLETHKGEFTCWFLASSLDMSEDQARRAVAELAARGVAALNRDQWGLWASCAPPPVAQVKRRRARK